MVAPQAAQSRQWGLRRLAFPAAAGSGHLAASRRCARRQYFNSIRRSLPRHPLRAGRAGAALTQRNGCRSCPWQQPCHPPTGLGILITWHRHIRTQAWGAANAASTGSRLSGAGSRGAGAE